MVIGGESEWLPSARSQERGPLAGAKVLVVDDNLDASYLMALVLEEAGATATQTDSVASALEILKTQAFTVLVSDISMPIADGYELIRSIRASASPSLRAMPAVAVTAVCTPADRCKVQAAGFQEYLPKPLNPKRLIEALQRLTASR